MNIDPRRTCRNVFSILALFLYFLMDSATVHGQAERNVFISDVDNFWIAFDSIQTVHEKDRQIQVMQSIYIDRGTYGLQEFMILRKFDAASLVESINKYPRFWNSIRYFRMRNHCYHQYHRRQMETPHHLAVNRKNTSFRGTE
jgi:hypothetical protein